MSVTDFTDAPPLGQKAVLLFWAPWHEDSVEGGPMDAVLRALAQSSSSSPPPCVFGRVEAEEYPDLTERYNVSVVPTFVLLDTKGSVANRLEGGDDVAAVTLAVQQLLSSSGTAQTAQPEADSSEASSSPPEEEEPLSDRLDRLIRSSQVMLFIKGTPEKPRCGFSRQACELLQEAKVPFGSFDILSDEAVRQGLKKHSDWPTYPQIYANGELMGGLDILKEMKEQHDEGSESLEEQMGLSFGSNNEKEEEEEVPGASAGNEFASLDDRICQLLRRHTVMLFMKGLPSAPRCGFSRQIVEILDKEAVAYDSFDILEDEEIRQGLKKFSDWPTYPQLYVGGELIGGLDIVREMHEDGELMDALKGED